MKRYLAGLPFAVLMTACASITLVPGAEKIVVTKNPADVEGCKILGSVKAEPPFNMPDDDKKQLQNEAAVLGADTVLVTSKPNVAAALFLPPAEARAANIRRGVAYKCEGIRRTEVSAPFPWSCPGFVDTFRLGMKGVHDAEDPCAVCAGVSEADGRIGSVGPGARGAVEGV